MKPVLAIFICLLAAPLFAQQAPSRGDVLVQAHLTENVFEAPTYFDLYLVQADASSYVSLPRAGYGYNADTPATHLGILAPRPRQLFFVEGSEIAVSTDARTVAERLRVKSSGEMAPLGTSFIVLGEARRLDYGYARPLSIFDADGTVLSSHEFVPRGDLYPPLHLEVLSDRCTLLYAPHYYSNQRAIYRYDLCKREHLPDFATNVPFVGSIRQLPDGDILVAAGFDVRRFNADGTLERTYDVHATRIALTPDASGFWAVGNPYWSGPPPAPLLYRIDFATPDAPAATVAINFARSNADYANSGIYTLAVVGEWRAAATKPKTRAARH